MATAAIDRHHATLQRLLSTMLVYRAGRRHGSGDAGEVWLLELQDQLAGLIVLERQSTHAEIFSVAVDPAHHGKGL